MKLNSYSTILHAPLGHVSPPTFKEGPTIGKGFLDGDVVDCIDLDTPQSQANRLEEALMRVKDDIGLPSIKVEGLDLLQLPHRLGDAILRDSLIEGIAFPESQVGQKLYSDPREDASAVFQQAPHALVFGYWLSQLKRHRQWKVTRCITSRIVGYDVQRIDVGGVRFDPLGIEDNITLYEPENPDRFWEIEPTDPEGNERSPVKSKEQGKKGRPSIKGHGNILISNPRPTFACRRIERNTVISEAPLTRLNFGNGDNNPAVRAVLLSLAKVALAADHEFGYDLRANCQLEPSESDIPSLEEAIAELNSARSACSLKWSDNDIACSFSENLRQLVERSHNQEAES